jgi:hypothetical protein
LGRYDRGKYTYCRIGIRSPRSGSEHFTPWTSYDVPDLLESAIISISTDTSRGDIVNGKSDKWYGHYRSNAHKTGGEINIGVGMISGKPFAPGINPRCMIRLKTPASWSRSGINSGRGKERTRILIGAAQWMPTRGHYQSNAHRANTPRRTIEPETPASRSEIKSGNETELTRVSTTRASTGPVAIQRAWTSGRYQSNALRANGKADICGVTLAVRDVVRLHPQCQRIPHRWERHGGQDAPTHMDSGKKDPEANPHTSLK